MALGFELESLGIVSFAPLWSLSKYAVRWAIIRKSLFREELRKFQESF
jgi:hypothetical protein